MKRHHILALFLLIFGGISAYLRYDDGDINGAIRTGAIFILASTAIFVLARLQPRVRALIVNAVVLIIMGHFIYQDFMAGDTVWAIILMIILVAGVILTLFENTPFVKKKIRPWLKTGSIYWGSPFEHRAHRSTNFPPLSTIRSI